MLNPAVRAAVARHADAFRKAQPFRHVVIDDFFEPAQAQALLQSLPDGPGIVGGDLNTWLGPEEPAWRLLLDRFDDTPSEALTPTFRDRLVLDHLFFGLPDRWEAAQQVVAERYGSDHHPVLGVVFEK